MLLLMLNHLNGTREIDLTGKVVREYNIGVGGIKVLWEIL